MHRASLQELMEQFGSFFRTKTDNIRHRLNSLPETSIAQPVGRRVAAVLRQFGPVTELEVLKIIRSSPKKTCQLDPMPTQVMMDYVHGLLPVITGIINMSHAFRHIPTSVKTALVTPLIKKPLLDKEVLQNCQPVSNLTFLSKVLERVVTTRLREYLTANCLLKPCQSAYRANHSTETALLRVHSDLLMTVDEGCAAFLVLLDPSAAFDTIDHGIPFPCLQSWFGIFGVALDWLALYLSDLVCTE